MIKNKRTSHGLDKRFAQINEFEESGVFEIRMPLDFKLGKNEVKLKLLPEKLLKGSEVLIDIFDKNGNSIYYEISKIANEDESRSLIIFIYEDTVPGKCRIFINAVLTNNKTYQCQITSDVLTTVENTQEIKFSEEPKVKYTEKQVQTQVFSTQTRKVDKVGTGDVSIVSSITPKNIERDNLAVEKKEISSVKSTTNLSNNVGSGSTFEIPTYFQPSTITARNFPFSSSMEGGTIFINGIQLEVPTDASSPTPFLNQSFSASILKVIGTGSIEIFPPFRKTIEYQTSTGLVSTTFDRFFNQSNFTCSYSEILTLATSGYSQSYAVFDLSNIQPEVGVVDAVEVSFKSLNQIGSNFQPLGTFEINGENLLIDSASVFFKNPDGIIETPIGNFRAGLLTFNQYWSTSSIGLNIPTASVSSRIVDGIKIAYEYRPSTGSFVIFEPKNQYKVASDGNNSQFNLTFDSFSENDLTGILPQLDIYISGSEIISEPIQESIALNPIQSGSLGTFIGSISEKFGKLRKNSLTFVSKTPGNIIPKLVSRAGKWHLGNFELIPVSEAGFNCNQTRIYAPMSIPTGSEVSFKIDYLNPAGRKTQNYSSLIEGVFFQGSTIRSGGGSSTTIPPGTVSGSDQLTGSFDTRYHKLGTGLLSSSNQIATDISGAFYSYTSSVNPRLNSLEQTSGSLNIFTGSITTRVDLLTNKTGSYATTGSNQFNGSQSISGSLIVSQSIRATEFSGIFNGVPSSSQQIKILLPTSTVSGSEQLTSSYDTRYERKGTGIYSSSGQLGPTGIYSGSGTVKPDTIVSASNLTFVTDNLDDFKTRISFERGYSDVTNDFIVRSGSIAFLTGKDSSEPRSYWEINDEEKTIKFGNFVPNLWHVQGEFLDGKFTLTAHTESQADDHRLEFGADGIIFSHYGNNPDGIKYGGYYSSSILANPLSLPDVSTVRLMLSQSTNFYSSSFDSKYERKGSGIFSSSIQFTSSLDTRYETRGNSIVSSSVQVKNLLPTSTVSGSEQLTSSYDSRYHRLGTGILSSSNQIATDISGSSTILSASLSGRIGVFEGKTLISGSSQVDYNQILNKIRTSGSFLNGIVISSGSDGSSSYSDPRLQWVPAPGTSSKMMMTGSLEINGNIAYTGSYAIKLQYTWGGPIVAGTNPGIVWTNMPNSKTTWLQTTAGVFSSDANYSTCVIGYSECQLITNIRIAGAGPTCSLSVEYSLDESAWNTLVSTTVGNTQGKKISDWTRIPVDLSTAITASLRLVGQGGNGAADPQFSPPHLLFR